MQNRGEQSNRRLATGALVLGAVALVASVFIPYGGLLGIVGSVMAKRARKGTYRRLATWGMIISILAIVNMIFVFISPAYPHVFPFKYLTHSET